MGSDVLAEQRLQGFEPLRCCGQGGLDRGDFPEPAEGADVWFEPAWGQPTVVQTGDYNVLICGESNRKSRSGHVSGMIRRLEPVGRPSPRPLIVIYHANIRRRAYGTSC